MAKDTDPFDQSRERTMVLRRRFLGSLLQYGIDPNSDQRSVFAAAHHIASLFTSDGLLVTLAPQFAFKPGRDAPYRSTIKASSTLAPPASR